MIMKNIREKFSRITSLTQCFWEQRNTTFYGLEELPGNLKSNVRIAIVGNAGYLSNLKQGRFIDDFDYVIRMNNFKIDGYEINIGEKSNIYLSSFFHNINFSNSNIRQSSHFISSVPNNFLLRKGLNQKHCFQLARGIKELAPKHIFSPSISEYIAIAKCLEAPPSTGLMAIFLASKYLTPIASEIFITGFSFMSGKNHYFSEEMADKFTHRPERERFLFKNFIGKRSYGGAIHTDAILRKYLDGQLA